jgi:hypothetical protein
MNTAYKSTPRKLNPLGRLENRYTKKDIQELLGKINYLRRFISNPAGRVESLLPFVQLKHE